MSLFVGGGEFVRGQGAGATSVCPGLPSTPLDSTHHARVIRPVCIDLRAAVGDPPVLLRGDLVLVRQGGRLLALVLRVLLVVLRRRLVLVVVALGGVAAPADRLRLAVVPEHVLLREQVGLVLLVVVHCARVRPLEIGCWSVGWIGWLVGWLGGWVGGPPARWDSSILRDAPALHVR